MYGTDDSDMKIVGTAKIKVDESDAEEIGGELEYI